MVLKHGLPYLIGMAVVAIAVCYKTGLLSTAYEGCRLLFATLGSLERVFLR